MTDRRGGEGTPPPWDILSAETVGEYHMFQVRRERVRVPRTGEERTFDLAVSPTSVVAVPVTDDERLIMVEQWRVPVRGVTLEFPAGVADEGEEPHEAARRELREETGYQGASAESIGTIVLNPSWQVLDVHVVLVRGARRVAGKELDDAEDTRVRLFTRGEVDRLVSEGRINSAVALGALALLDRRG